MAEEMEHAIQVMNVKTEMVWHLVLVRKDMAFVA